MPVNEPIRIDRELNGTLAFLGGVYSNHLALRAVLADARARGAEAVFCLGDLGGFGPNPGKIYPILDEFGVRTLAGNYDISLATRLTNLGLGWWNTAQR